MNGYVTRLSGGENFSILQPLLIENIRKMVIKVIKIFENVNFRGVKIPECGKNLVGGFPNL